MSYRSLLFTEASPPEVGMSEPAYFADLNLDQFVAAITADKAEYDLAPLFYQPLHDLDAILWRHEVLRDLEDEERCGRVGAFAQAMREVRAHLAQAEKRHHELQRQRWFLDAVRLYCAAVRRLADDLAGSGARSRALLAFRDYLRGYLASEAFTSLDEQSAALEQALDAIRYTVQIKDLRVEVGDYAGEADYGAEVEATFAKFEQGDAKPYPFDLPSSADMTQVEARILELVARLHPEPFAELADFCAARRDFRDAGVATFDRELQFYLAYLGYAARFERAGLELCYPRLSRSKEIFAAASFDLVLAEKLLGEGERVVCNDLRLGGKERITVVTGPNQGGKTTFARTFGQLHHLASLGLKVPARRAQLFLCDAIFTHFEREEVSGSLQGKLQDDLLRIHRILARATSESILILNEIFNSTTLQDALALSYKVAERIVALDLLCVWVTFLDELASLGESTVSVVSTVAPDNPARRTYKVLRRPADGLAYALSIAEKHRLTREQIKARIA